MPARWRVLQGSELRHEHAQTGSNTGSHTERQPIRLSPQEQQDLVAFLRTLSAAPLSVASARGASVVSNREPAFIAGKPVGTP